MVRQRAGVSSIGFSVKVAIERLDTGTNFGVEIVLGLTSAALFRGTERQSHALRWLVGNDRRSAPFRGPEPAMKRRSNDDLISGKRRSGSVRRRVTVGRLDGGVPFAA